MKRLWLIVLIFICLIVSGLVAAQDMPPEPTATPTATIPAPLATEEITAETTPESDEPFIGRASVGVVSAFVRDKPSEEGDAVASVFEDDIIEVVGRNVDGTWFEVRRPGRIFNLGWIFGELISLDFAAEDLPMTSNEVIPIEGEDGTDEVIIIEDTGFAVFVQLEATLRDAPFTSGEALGLIPHTTIVPVIGRDRDGTWLFVNYRGTEGWISNITYREPDNIAAIPEVVVEGVPVINAPIIPPEIQLAQLEAFRAYVINSRDVAIGLRDFWYNVAEGEVMPCEPPPFVSDYLYTSQDVQQLPELDRYAPRFNQGIGFLNDAIDPLTTCGVLRRDLATAARNAAINASVIFEVTLNNLDFVETIITGED